MRFGQAVIVGFPGGSIPSVLSGLCIILCLFPITRRLLLSGKLSPFFLGCLGPKLGFIIPLLLLHELSASLIGIHIGNVGSTLRNRLALSKRQRRARSD